MGFICASAAAEAECKVFKTTHVDCAYRDLTAIPKNLPSSSTHLDLSYNSIPSLTPGCFGNLYSLEELTMHFSGGLIIDADAFKGLHKLRSLIFDGNGYITFVNGRLNDLPSLKTLEFPIKTFCNMPDDLLSNLMNLSKLTIHLNPIDDENQNSIYVPPSLFRGLEHLEELNIIGPLDSFSANFSSVSFKDLGNNLLHQREFEMSNYPLQNLSRLATLTLDSWGFKIVVVIVASLVKRFHWHMRYAYFHIKLRLGGYQLQINDEERPINKRYDAFVVYNQNDSDWVIHELSPHLENIDPPNFKLCIHERDFIPGNDIFENVLDSIEQSKKTMLILSPDFAASEWCYFETRMVHRCLIEEKRDIIIMVSLKKIPDDDMPRILRNILLNKTYLEWPENEIGRRLFWEKLKVALRPDCKAKRMADPH
ncbi:toll-like receptor 6 [Ptychodera flava]|uniref:toll-like receptor 6 n=1 Tax=Ptychodera flava TaxID=63121 RepID=UPI003969ED09